MCSPHLLYAEQKPGAKDLTMEIPTPQDHHAVAIANASEWDAVVIAMTQVVSSIHGTAHRIGRTWIIKSPARPAPPRSSRSRTDDKNEQAASRKSRTNPRLRDHALFIAFAPVDKPRIVVAVVVENGGGGASAAAPIARTIIDQYLNRKST